MSITVSEIEEALSRSVCGGWDRGFLESVLGQLSKGKRLSAKQQQTMSKVLQRNTLDSQIQHESWRTTYESEYKVQAQILASYHSRQPYYRPMASDILAGKIPERSKFLRMYQNKYSARVLEQATATPKYEKGSYLIPRARFDSYKNVETESDLPWVKQKQAIEAFKVRGGFVMEVCGDIHSAAAGAKRYKLLPIGQTIPLIVEERFLKISRRKK